MSTLRNHNGQLLEATVVATFLPREGPSSLLPPPARNRAEGVPPFRATTRWAISPARAWAGC